MSTVEDLQNTLTSFPSTSPDPEDLARLRAFFERMKQEGVAMTRRYDLPALDTIGRGLIEARSVRPSST